MVPKVKKETPAPPRAEANAMALKTKVVLKRCPPPQQEHPNITYLLPAQDPVSAAAALTPPG